MTRFEHFCVTGTGSVFQVKPEFSDLGFADIGYAAELGCLDAPKRIAAGSHVALCWYGVEGQSTIEREARP